MILALDVGTRRIGVAISDPTDTYALPVETLERTNLRADLARIADLAASYGAQTIVVGDPIALDGTRALAAEKMDEFCVALSKRYAGTIARVDERLTTAQATKTLLAGDVSRKKRRDVVDRLAAALILESYLARRGRTL